MIYLESQKSLQVRAKCFCISFTKFCDIHLNNSCDSNCVSEIQVSKRYNETEGNPNAAELLECFELYDEKRPSCYKTITQLQISFFKEQPANTITVSPSLSTLQAHNLESHLQRLWMYPGS